MGTNGGDFYKLVSRRQGPPYTLRPPVSPSQARLLVCGCPTLWSTSTERSAHAGTEYSVHRDPASGLPSRPDRAGIAGRRVRAYAAHVDGGGSGGCTGTGAAINCWNRYRGTEYLRGWTDGVRSTERTSAQGIYINPNTQVLIAYQQWWRGYRPPVESKAGGFRGFLVVVNGSRFESSAQRESQTSLLSAHLRKEGWRLSFCTFAAADDLGA